jgi:hypothetical protein
VEERQFAPVESNQLGRKFEMKREGEEVAAREHKAFKDFNRGIREIRGREKDSNQPAAFAQRIFAEMNDCDGLQYKAAEPQPGR